MQRTSESIDKMEGDKFFSPIKHLSKLRTIHSCPYFPIHNLSVDHQKHPKSGE